MKKTIAVVVCCVALLASCQQTEEIMNPSEELVMSIEASIGETGVVAGRYAGTDPNGVEFIDGDLVGLSVNGGSFVKWVYDGDIWKRNDGNVAYWNEKDETHIFKAFYPFDEFTSEGVVKMPELKKQDGTMESVSLCDFLVATKEESYGTSNGTVSLTFNHVSSLVTIRFKGDGDLVGATIDKITITGSNILSSSTYSFNNENHITLADEDLSTIVLEPEGCKINEGQNKEFYLIFNSGTVNLSEVKLVIEYGYSNQAKYTATLNGLGNSQDKFISGKQHVFNLKIADGVLSVKGNSIADWSGEEPMEDIIINGIENITNGID